MIITSELFIRNCIFVDQYTEKKFYSGTLNKKNL